MNRLTLLVLAGALLLVAIVAWRQRREETRMPGGDAAPRGAADDDGIDWEELERAEREVQELDHDGAGGAPEQQSGDDWGPGRPKPPLA